MAPNMAAEPAALKLFMVERRDILSECMWISPFFALDMFMVNNPVKDPFDPGSIQGGESYRGA